MDMHFHRCWAEVDLDALQNNFGTCRTYAGDSTLFAVVKANAYGHGDLPAAAAFRAAGADRFAVACLEEALHLRRGGITQPILILGPVPAQAAPLLAREGLTAPLSDMAFALALSRCAAGAGVEVEVHIKLDTGMGRIGFRPGDGIEAAAEAVAQAVSLPGIRATGIFTHFAVADSMRPADISYTREQYRLFSDTISALEERGIRGLLCHCCNSAALVAYPRMLCSGARPGIVLYGCPPSSEVPFPGLRTTMVMKATVGLVKTLPAGAHVGYGCTYKADGPVTVATVTAGYADGYPRAASGKGVCSVGGKAAPVIGRVCMDQMMLDVSACGPVAPGDEVILFGDGAADTLDGLAVKAGTIPHEIMCGLGPRVERIYLRGGAQVPPPTV